jgi:hypothetical protein
MMLHCGGKCVGWEAACAEFEWLHQPATGQHYCVLVAVTYVSLCIACNMFLLLLVSLCLCRPQILQRSTGQDIANLLWGLGHIHEKQQQRQADQGGDSAAPPSHCISAKQLLALAQRLLEVRGIQGQCCLLPD